MQPRLKADQGGGLLCGFFAGRISCDRLQFRGHAGFGCGFMNLRRMALRLDARGAVLDFSILRKDGAAPLALIMQQVAF